MKRTFQCSVCGETFYDEWTVEEAEAEYAAAFQGEGGGRESACDDCYQKVVAWGRSQGLVAGGSA